MIKKRIKQLKLLIDSGQTAAKSNQPLKVDYFKELHYFLAKIEKDVNQLIRTNKDSAYNNDVQQFTNRKA